MDQQILIAGVGNIFFGDDGFGVEVAHRLMARILPAGVVVADYGIRGMDLAYALMDDHAAVVVIDAAARGERPGTLSLIEHNWDSDGIAVIETHAMDPVKVIRFARDLGARPVPTYIVACEPETLGHSEGYSDVLVNLSEPVRGSLDEAVLMVEALVLRLLKIHCGGGELACVGE